MDCEKCGGGLGSGRYCTSCGHPVPATGEDHGSWRTDTAERPRVVAPPAPVVPPPPPAPPERSRFPLFADEVAGPDETLASHEPPGHAAAPVPDDEPRRHRERGRAAGWLPWGAGLAGLVLVAATGAWLLTGGDDPSPARAGAAGDASPGHDRTPEPTTDDRGPNRSPDRSPDRTPEPDAGQPADRARFATVDAPPAAPPSQDNSGNAVRYGATNMVDGVPETTWRTPGDATGETVTFSFDEPVALSEVGLVNGYAKVGQDRAGILDWYHGNRRVLAVEWTFDDDTVLAQGLDDTTIMQTLPVDGIETRTVVLRLVEVSAPGSGRASRDYTAISDVRLFGTTG